MKIKLFLATISLLFLASFAQADDRTRIRNTDSEVNVVQWSTATFSAANLTISSSTYRNCLSYLVVGATNAHTTTVLLENATHYQLTLAASAAAPAPIGNWSPLCGPAAQRMYINVTCSGCTPQINYQHFLAQ